MEEFKISVFIAIFEELFGFWVFWSLLLLAVVGIGLFFYFLIKEKRNSAKDFAWAKWAAPITAVVSVPGMLWFTLADFSDIGGMTDVIFLGLIALFSALAATVLAYIAQSFLTSKDKATS